MLSKCLAVDIHHQIGKSVYHLWLLAKTLGRVHHPEDFYNALQPVERSLEWAKTVRNAPRYTNGPENFSSSAHASGPKVSFHRL